MHEDCRTCLQRPSGQSETHCRKEDTGYHHLVKGTNGFIDTNYLSRAKAAVEAAKKYDFVYMHVGATDEAGHLGIIEEKIRAIENLDKAVGYILKNFDGVVMLMPDHLTPIAKKTHTNDPVPFAIMGKDAADGCEVYTEKEVKEKGGYGFINAVNLLAMTFKK